jgi:hypothetical protein
MGPGCSDSISAEQGTLNRIKTHVASAQRVANVAHLVAEASELLARLATLDEAVLEARGDVLGRQAALCSPGASGGRAHAPEAAVRGRRVDAAVDGSAGRAVGGGRSGTGGTYRFYAAFDLMTVNVFCIWWN